MAYKISLTSSDVDRQINILKYFPEIASARYRPALKRSSDELAAVIRPTIPILTGKAQSTFGSRVSGTKIESLQAQVGWYDKGDPWYINIVEYGARAHKLEKGSSSRSKRAQAALAGPDRKIGRGVHVKIGDRWVTMEVHPGFSKRGFMAAGYSAAQPLVNYELAQANEAVVRDLAVPS